MARAPVVVVGKPYDLSEIVEATIKALPVDLRPGD
jgi:hypothetical protein